MISEEKVVRLVGSLRRADLADWVREGWVRPVRRGGRSYYREIDVARIRLILELRRDLNIRGENIPVFLSLIDQIHGLRRQLRRVAEAIDSQPNEIRDRIARQLSEPS